MQNIIIFANMPSDNIEYVRSVSKQCNLLSTLNIPIYENFKPFFAFAFTVFIFVFRIVNAIGCMLG